MPVTPNEADSEDTADIAIARRVMTRITSGDEQLLTSAELDELLAATTPLAFYRQRAGLTQATLAQRTGLAQSELAAIEARRKSADIPTMGKIAEALNLTIDDLVVSKSPASRPANRQAAR
ncbi:DNA-binding XRE family transcriptional regulator [Rhodopseudomonas faecalis]|uniref:DNA-binding XRE family transcriptional regulator n=1 Tax=Rhodopseudomonas faecalis TaxID=99655 RepID=A0A318TST5_9BRAD|nr:helix-turn-helix transcriptional regulator [Rhodopseudomonas faecalis]PYF04915.1 DNA-binding XRE family transcriptional regulator [Rhodopseudomonas faecalis]TAH69284.1 MAG: XRE family transcriptional regulator [Rhodopseudomonas palustris]